MKKAICFLPNHGYVLFIQESESNKVKVIFRLEKFEKFSTHAIHIHEYGDLSNGCISLGFHYNPFHTTHGSRLFINKERHAGDLINNLYSDSNGNFVYEYIDDLITLYGEESILGRSVVIHEGIDDLGCGQNELKKESLISGNAGKRISCGIIGLQGN
jgi:Cu-Zn family superoxide dismutase